MDRFELAKKVMPPGTCGYNGHLVKRCSFVRDGCGYFFSAAERGMVYCPRCGLDRFCYNYLRRGKTSCKTHKGRDMKNSLATKLTRKDALPENLKATYEASLEDPGLLELTRDLALSEALIVQNLERLDKGDPGNLWITLKDLWKKRKKVVREAAKLPAGTPRRDDLLAQISEIEDDITEILEGGADEWQALNKDLPNQLELRRRLVLTEYQRLEKLQYMVRVEQFINFSDMLATAVLQYASTEAQREIFAKMSRFLEEGNYNHTPGYQLEHSHLDYRLIED